MTQLSATLGTRPGTSPFPPGRFTSFESGSAAVSQDRAAGKAAPGICERSLCVTCAICLAALAATLAILVFLPTLLVAFLFFLPALLPLLVVIAGIAFTAGAPASGDEKPNLVA